MPKPPAQPFSPPSPQQVRRHLDRYPARGPSSLVVGLPMMLFIASMLVILCVNNSAAVALALLMMVAFSAFQLWRRRWERGLQSASHGQAQELASVRHWSQSLRIAWRSLPSLEQLSGTPTARTIAVMAHDLDQLKAYESAITAYDFLIDHLPAQHVGSIQFRIQRALAQFALDRLTDADQTLRRLRGQIENYRGTPAAALYRLAMLVQEVRTNHYADAIAGADNLLDELRPLGVESGYGYCALPAAMSYAHVDPHPRNANKVSRLQPNLVVAGHAAPKPVTTLVDRFPDLEFMTGKQTP